MARKSSRLATKPKPETDNNEGLNLTEEKHPVKTHKDQVHEHKVDDHSEDDDFEDVIPKVTSRKRNTKAKVSSSDSAPPKKRAFKKQEDIIGEANAYQAPITIAPGEYLEISIPDPTLPEIQLPEPKAKPKNAQSGRASPYLILTFST